jgi:hypothetical protein
MSREQAEQFAEWLESMAGHVRWCVDMPPYLDSTPPVSSFSWANEHGDLARLWIANNVGGDFT